MFNLFDLNMKLKQFPIGVRPLDMKISSINKDFTIESIENSPGNIRYGSRDVTREIVLSFYLEAKSGIHFRYLRDQVFNFLNGEMYVVESYRSDRRFLVEVQSVFTPERYDSNQTQGELIVTCVTTNLPYSESVVAEMVNSLEFIVEGDEQVEPFKQHLAIEIENIDSNQGYFKLINQDNNSFFQINEELTNDDVIKIDGVNVTLNGAQALRLTEKTFITLTPGLNTFIIEGAQNADVHFEFRNYYR